MAEATFIDNPIARPERATYKTKWREYATWNDLNDGDPVKVAGEMGVFVFKAVGVVEGIPVHVRVHGGTVGNTTVRFFTPERVTKVVPKVRKRRGKQVAEATDAEDDE